MGLGNVPENLVREVDGGQETYNIASKLLGLCKYPKLVLPVLVKEHK